MIDRRFSLSLLEYPVTQSKLAAKDFKNLGEISEMLILLILIKFHDIYIFLLN
jgi:hypothetical protein